MISITQSRRRSRHPFIALTMLVALLSFLTVSEGGLLDNAEKAFAAAINFDEKGLDDSWKAIKNDFGQLALNVIPGGRLAVKAAVNAKKRFHRIKGNLSEGLGALAIDRDEKDDYEAVGIRDGQSLPSATSYAANNEPPETETCYICELEAEQERQQQEEQARLAEQARQQQAEQDALFEQQLLQGLSQQSETKKQADANYRESVSEAAVEAEELKRDIEQSSKETADSLEKIRAKTGSYGGSGVGSAPYQAGVSAGTGVGSTLTNWCKGWVEICLKNKFDLGGARTDWCNDQKVREWSNECR